MKQMDKLQQNKTKAIMALLMETAHHSTRLFFFIDNFTSSHHPQA